MKAAIVTDLLSIPSELRAGGWTSRKAKSSSPAKTYQPGIHMYAQERAEAGESRERDAEFYYLAFRLTDEFIEPYKTRAVAWGFPVGGNVTLGEINWLTKYSARKADGAKERYWEGLRRVIEGMYSIQKEHAARYRLPWSDRTAATSAQEAYERAFTGKWSPPGRGFWKMGHFFVNGLGDSSALQNCFAGAEEFVTREHGVVSFDEVVGQNVTVFTSEGWRKADIESFGEQSVQRITFAPAHTTSRGSGYRMARSNHRVVVTATPNHRWILKGGQETVALALGNIVECVSPEGVDVDTADYDNGLRHGIIFGDGTRSTFTYKSGKAQFHIRFCGERAQQHVGLFHHATYPPAANGDPWAFVESDDDLKDFPDSAKSDSYLRGFLQGWIDADATLKPGGQWSLSSQHVGAKAWLERNAYSAGWVLRGVNVDSVLVTNYGPRKNPMFRYTLARGDLAWKVVGVDSLSEPEPVYCAVVPEVGSFALASGVYTGNCAFLSTAFIGGDDPAFPFYRLMEMSMLGIGVGFDTKGAGKIRLQQPIENGHEHVVIDDSREGWYESVRMVLESFFTANKHALKFDYSEIRPRGKPIKGFGGTAAGPEPLIQLHRRLNALLNYRHGELLTSSDIVDIQNVIGKCVVAANVRSSAEIALGDPTDDAYINLKNPEVNVERMGFVRGPDGKPAADETGKWIESEEGGWGYTSNNSILAEVGGRYDHIGKLIAQNGEPGLVWLDVARKYGRLADPANNKDHRVMGVNPCAEQFLEHNELCTLVESYPTNCKSKEDYLRTLKFAYLYGKTVTLLPTHWEETNEVMMRNRRIGASMSGLAQFVEDKGWGQLREWQDEGYAEIRRWDTLYSEWLGIRESIKVTTIKPSGTVSLLFGVTPGAHWPTARNQYFRRLRLTSSDPVGIAMAEAGFHIEPNVQNPVLGVVVTCPTKGPDIPSEREVPVALKLLLAAQCQEWWSDNAVSLTASFMAEAEGGQIGPLLQAFDGKFKSISFLGMSDDSTPYAQMPYEQVPAEQFEMAWGQIGNLDWDRLYAGEALDAVGERYCTTEACEVAQ